jgi:hypothetical protein
MKVWRVLNLSSGTIYTTDYGTFQEAFDSIQDGKKRGAFIVKRVTVTAISQTLEDFEFLQQHKIAL